MTSDGVNSYTWDRANRLLSMGGVDYQYDGEGRRVQQTVSSTITKYLLDIQPGLAVVLSETASANTMRYVHSPRGIHAHKDTGGNWEWMVQDGLGSVREVVDNTVNVLESRNYDPYGNPFGATGTSQTGYGFTGELVDGSGLLDLRARRYNAELGQFIKLDPLETPNQYSYVHGNPVNWVDLDGLLPSDPGIQEDKYRYSAKCGWLDLGHAGWQGARYHEQIAGALKYRWINAGQISAPSGRVIRVETPTQLFGVNFWVYVADSLLSNNNTLEGISLGIFKEFHEIYEGQQSIANPFVSLVDVPADILLDGRASGFSEEDLPSNLIGYYLHKNYNWNWHNTHLVSGSGNTDVFPALQNMCQVMSREDTNKVYAFYSNYYYEHEWFVASSMPNGLFMLNWTNWYRRPSQITDFWNEIFPNTPKPASEQWPAELTSFSATSIPKKGTLPIERFKTPQTLPTDGWYKITGAGSDTAGLVQMTNIADANSIAKDAGFTPFVGPVNPNDFVLNKLYKVNKTC